MNEALRRIIEAKATRSESLDLSFIGISDLPQEIEELENLVELNLSNNYFSRLPKVVNSLKRLQSLNLSNNCFNYINDIGFDFPCYLPIRYLDISKNNLTQIPEDVFDLEYLDELIIEGNDLLKGVPDIIKEVGYIAVYNFVYEVKKSVSTESLLEAKLIFVGQGEVGKTSLMKKLMEPSIKIQAGGEPTTHGINIKRWSLGIEFDKYEREVYLNEIDNHDTDDTDDINGYDNYIDLNGESYYDDYPKDKSEPIASGSYIHDAFDEEYSNALFNVEYDRLVNPLSQYFESDLTQDETYTTIKTAKLNVWDFGGQEIYYSTHQFFLTKRSIYIFVWDARKEEDYKSFEYWFNTINILSERSPIIIVMNKVDERTRNIDERILKENFQNIQRFCKTSCITGEGIEELKESIKVAFKSLPHIGDKLPIVWIDIRGRLSGLNESSITYNTYVDLCKVYNIDERRANFLSSYLHDLGDILHFQNDEMLKQIVILKPDWVTNAFYRLIDSKLIQLNYGQFSFNQLSNIWDVQQHPTEKHFQLLRLIENFELCFNIVGSKDYIIPELLPASFNGVIAYTKSQSEIKFEYRFKFMPAGLMSRFICRNFLYIEQKNFWKNGLVIRYEESLALIVSNALDKKITVSIDGEDNAALLAIIRREFNFLFDSLNLESDIDYLEMIPCNCDICARGHNTVYYQFTVLKKFMSRGKSYISCQNSTDDVYVPDLVKGYGKVKLSEQILNHLIIACSQLQGNHMILANNREDSRNTLIANALTNRGIIAKDQSRWGRSATNKSQGELDIKLEDYNGAVLGIFEGINLRSIDTNKIHLHLEKIFNYDPNGLESNYIVTYSEADDFIDLWKKYQLCAMTANYKYEILGAFEDITNNYMCGSQMKIGKTSFKINDKRNNVYHIFVNMNIIN